MTEFRPDEKVRIFSNLNVFFDIAYQAYQDAMLSLQKNVVPKEGGGFVIADDPQRVSFKQSLIAISFFGSYLDLYIRMKFILQELQMPNSQQDRVPYEEKLRYLGITDEDFLNDVKEFRSGRNDVSHEKPIVSGWGVGSMGNAQDGAELGLRVVTRLKELLPLNFL
ncbi:hypothetical protein [Bdellovibrio bacteriovorus]|uniref:hypothetical protein n=1 Tax=Bdellovibrio bacteriovorus TaxID=959 RepID=UPI003AA94AE7